MFKTLFVVLTAAVVCCQCSIGYAAPKTATLAIQGMTCSTCPIAVKTALTRIEGVSSADVSFEKKEVTVTFDDAKTTVQALTRATADAGFPSTLIGGASK